MLVSTFSNNFLSKGIRFCLPYRSVQTFNHGDEAILPRIQLDQLKIIISSASFSLEIP